MNPVGEKQAIKPYRRHIFFCVGKSCYQGEDSIELYSYLKMRLHELGLDQGANRVMRSKSTCLGVCCEGPVAVVYPEAVWYKELNKEKLDRIIDEHLAGGIPVQNLTFSSDITQH